MIPNISLGNDQILRFDRILADVPYVQLPHVFNDDKLTYSQM
jgi:hypothetical protein